MRDIGEGDIAVPVQKRRSSRSGAVAAARLRKQHTVINDHGITADGRDGTSICILLVLRPRAHTDKRGCSACDSLLRRRGLHTHQHILHAVAQLAKHGGVGFGVRQGCRRRLRRRVSG